MKRTRGFTLIELMVVMAIVAVIGLVAVNMSMTTFGANPTTSADQVSSAFNFAKLRAVLTRRSHRVRVTPQSLLIYQGDTTGLTAPTTYQFISKVTLPVGSSIWNATTAIATTAGSTSVTQNASLQFDVDFKPDGSSTGGTVFITDPLQARTARVLVYRVTGSSYARQPW